jgi:hypothetical protein
LGRDDRAFGGFLIALGLIASIAAGISVYVMLHNSETREFYELHASGLFVASMVFLLGLAVTTWCVIVWAAHSPRR